jgi:hypothetical protein
MRFGWEELSNEAVEFVTTDSEEQALMRFESAVARFDLIVCDLERASAAFVRALSHAGAHVASITKPVILGTMLAEPPRERAVH